MSDSDPHATFGYVARRLDGDGLAYLHVVEPVCAVTMTPSQRLGGLGERLAAHFQRPAHRGGGLHCG
jgi:hypothetical protein